MMHGKTYSQRSAPAGPMVDQEHGRFEAKSAALAAALVFGSLLVGAVFGLITVAATPEYSYDTISGYRLIFWWFGLIGAMIAVVFGGVLLWITVADWLDYRERRRLDFDTALAARQEQPVILEQEITEWTLLPGDTRSELLTSLACYYRYMNGDMMPHTNNKLTGRILLDTGNEGTLVGELTQQHAEQMGNRFAELGLVEGRGPKVAGRWIADDPGELIRTIVSGQRRREKRL